MGRILAAHGLQKGKDYTAVYAGWRDLATQIGDGTLDAVLIDALHFEPHVSDDIRAWWPKLRRGGVMIGDDYGSYYPGVEIGVQAVFGERYKVLGQTWWVTNAHTA